MSCNPRLLSLTSVFYILGTVSHRSSIVALFPLSSTICPQLWSALMWRSSWGLISFPHIFREFSSFKANTTDGLSVINRTAARRAFVMGSRFYCTTATGRGVNIFIIDADYFWCPHKKTLLSARCKCTNKEQTYTSLKIEFSLLLLDFAG